MNKLSILKTSWGIAIFYEIIESPIDSQEGSDNICEIVTSVYLNLNDNKIDNISLEYLKAGIQSITQYINTFPITFNIEKLKYSICDYQPEGMYYMFRKWFFESHNMDVPPINVYYDKETNRYIFPDLKNLSGRQ